MGGLISFILCFCFAGDSKVGGFLQVLNFLPPLMTKSTQTTASPKEFKGVSLTLCCFVVYSTRRFVVYVFPCVILFLRFSVLLVLRLPRLGMRELILVLFVRLFDLCLFGFVGFLFLGFGKGCGL